MNPDDAFDRCLAALHEAALDDARWPVAAALIEAACGATGNLLAVGERTGGVDVRIDFYNYLLRGELRPDVARRYFQLYHDGDEGMARFRRLPTGHLSNLSRSGGAFGALPAVLLPPAWVRAEHAGGRRLRAEWAEVPGMRYGVELLLGGEPVEGRSLRATTRTDFRWSGLEPGTYRVRVRTVDADGAAGPWSGPSNEVEID